MKRLYQSFCGLMLLLVLMTSVKAQGSSLFNFPEKEFDTPEAAIRHFVESIAKNDLEGALQAFAINDYARNFDFAAQAQRLGAMNPSFSLAPTNYPMYVQINQISLLSRYSGQIAFFCYSFNSTVPLDGKPSYDVTDENINDFVSSINPEKLVNLRITRIVKAIAASTRSLELFQEQATSVSALEATELLVLYSLNDRLFFGGVSLLRYEKSWKISALYSIIAQTSPRGNVIEMTATDFETMLNELSKNVAWKLKEITQ